MHTQDKMAGRDSKQKQRAGTKEQRLPREWKAHKECVAKEVAGTTHKELVLFFEFETDTRIARVWVTADCSTHTR